MGRGGGGSVGCRGRGRFERAQEFGADHLGDRNAIADVANRILQQVGLRDVLAVVDQITVEVNLEGASTRWGQRDADLAIPTSDYLACQTGSLIPVASRNAVANLELNFAFSHNA